MTHKLCLLYFFTCFYLFSYAQQDINQKMMNRLDAGNYLEAKKFYSYSKTWGYALNPSIENYYNYSMANFHNKPDSAAIYLENVLQSENIYDVSFIFELYYRLWKLYAETLQNYVKALSTCNRIKSFIKENPYSVNEQTLIDWNEFVSEWERQTLRRMNEPAIRILRNDSKNTTAILSDSIINNLLFFEATYNQGIKIKTVFDTGISGYFQIHNDIAKKIGVRKYPINDADTVLTINGIQVQGYSGILDSVQIANIVLYNIPVYVLANSLVNVDSLLIDTTKKKKLNSFYKSMEIIMGLKAMSLIERIVLDWKNNQLCFPVDKYKTEVSKNPNLFWLSDKVFTQIQINKLPLAVFLDTGDSDYATIDSWFYEKHKEHIPIDTSINKEILNQAFIHGVRQNIPYELVSNPHISVNDMEICTGKDNKVYIKSLMDLNSPNTNPSNNLYLNITDGVVGYNFFKHLGHKIMFDFRNIRIDIIE